MATARPTYDGAPYQPDSDRHRRRCADAIALLMAGKSNCVLDVTLAAGVATTTITDQRIGYFTAIVLMPLTANAAAAIATTYFLQAGLLKGTAVATHANNAQVDRTFRAVLIG